MADISKIKPNGSSGTEYDIKDATARSALENKANNTQTFTEASTRANIASGETMSTLFGKIKKFFTDLKTVAFTGSYSDLSDQPTITDEKVKQENTTGSADYRVLLSNGANDTTETKTARKSTNLKFNPSTGNLQATQLNGVTIGSSPKFTDNNTTYTLSADTDNNKIKLTPSSGSAQSITVPYATASGMCVGQATSAVNDTDGNPIKTTYSKTDEKVKQENTTTNAEYRILFSNGANDTTETKTARKNTNLKYNPSTKILTADSINAAIKAGGKIRIYNDTGTYYVELISDTTANRQFILPNSGSTDTLATREYLNSNLRCNKLNTFVNIVGYTSSNKYEFPSDGYLWFSGGVTSDSNITLAGSNGTEIWCTFNTNSKPQMVFVRKGMKFWVTSNNSATCRFFALTD